MQVRVLTFRVYIILFSERRNNKHETGSSEHFMTESRNLYNSKSCAKISCNFEEAHWSKFKTPKLVIVQQTIQV